MIKWPDGLPFPLREGYGFKTVEPMARTSLQSGRARYRRNFSNVPVALEVSWLFTAEQARLFKGWYRDVLKDGVKWFECDLRTEEGIVPCNLHFDGIYDGGYLVGRDHWRFNATVVMRERSIIDPGWAEILPEYILLADIFDIAMNREWPRHGDGS
ncbi:TPA: hypothetical protein ACXJEI_001023 [Pseudomonas aeruginosa]|uniref:hypothetical protein n=1 Tax=Pseudomonas aeruginosa TaxID=287 RepID=UPI000F5ECD4A|nr:hypothetical protein [Pseudomonas aeruginosa]RQX77144.1 hypothetical protein IPC927_09570 [Pseudomonas aeruginosa]HCG1237082.1 hypothetical protein [Pseudomonas aeruginosa]